MDTSFKGVVFRADGKVLLGFNPRSEWELLGGRAEECDRLPVEVVRREVLEEAGITIRVGAIVDAWIYDVMGEGRVCVVSYLAEAEEGQGLNVSDEHSWLRWFSAEEVGCLEMPQEYKKTIALATKLRAVSVDHREV